MEGYIGKKLDGRYEINEVVGVGGMAVVYKAYDTIEQRTVAVKILKDEFLANEEFKRRFRNESKAIAMLSHPNIVKVYDVSLSETVQYIVMEFIDGITLKEYIEQKGVLPWKETVHFTVQILRAMQHAHDRGIVHRDLKPQNIMLLSNGSLKIADFGIARFSRSETRTITDKAIGSVHYISPEQARGGYIDEKADIYSVGVMMYEMLTGKVPFDAENAVSVAIMQMQADPKRPRELNDSIPEGLEQVTQKAMQKDTAMRYQSAAEMLRDIEEFKKNPSIQFEYKYFGDTPNAKYVDAINQVKNTSDYSGYNRRKSPLIPILAGVAAAFVLLMLGLGIWALDHFEIFSFRDLFGLTANNSEHNIEVPNLIGMKLDDAVNLEVDGVILGDIIEVEREVFNEDYEAGVIFWQTPRNPVNIDASSRKITVRVSLGPETAEIPAIVGQSKSDAERLLIRAGFNNFKFVEVTSEEVALGQVISCTPDQYTKATKGQEITVVVSTGPEVKEIEMTVNLIGKTPEEARIALERIGLTLDMVNIVQEDSYLDVGLITFQSVPVGTKTTNITPIQIHVSNGIKPANSYDVYLNLSQYADYQTVKLKWFMNSALSGEGEFMPNASVFVNTVTGNSAGIRMEYKISTDGGLTWATYVSYTIDLSVSPPVVMTN